MYYDNPRIRSKPFLKNYSLINASMNIKKKYRVHVFEGVKSYGVYLLPRTD